MDLVVVAIAFGAIFVVELPDKTFLATLVLATRYRPLFVWIGVGLAFAVQTVVAVLLGHAASFLPEDLVRRRGGRDVPGRRGAAAARGPGRTTSRPARSTPPTRGDVHGVRRCWPASWCSSRPSGATCASCSRSRWSPGTTTRSAVFVGALGALLTVSALAVVAGRQLLR